MIDYGYCPYIITEEGVATEFRNEHYNKYYNVFFMSDNARIK